LPISSDGAAESASRFYTMSLRRRRLLHRLVRRRQGQKTGSPLGEPETLYSSGLVIHDKPRRDTDPFKALRCSTLNERRTSFWTKIRKPTENVFSRVPLERAPKTRIDVEEAEVSLPVANRRVLPEQVPRARVVAIVGQEQKDK
jgi:hypothetical protein